MGHNFTTDMPHAPKSSSARRLRATGSYKCDLCGHHEWACPIHTVEVDIIPGKVDERFERRHARGTCHICKNITSWFDHANSVFLCSSNCQQIIDGNVVFPPLPEEPMPKGEKS